MCNSCLASSEALWGRKRGNLLSSVLKENRDNNPLVVDTNDINRPQANKTGLIMQSLNNHFISVRPESPQKKRYAYSTPHNFKSQ